MDNTNIPIIISEVPPRRQSSGLSFILRSRDPSNSEAFASSPARSRNNSITSSQSNTNRSFSQTILDNWLTVTSAQKSFDQDTQDSLPPWVSRRAFAKLKETDTHYPSDELFPTLEEEDELSYPDDRLYQFESNDYSIITREDCSEGDTEKVKETAPETTTTTTKDGCVYSDDETVAYSANDSDSQDTIPYSVNDADDDDFQDVETYNITNRDDDDLPETAPYITVDPLDVLDVPLLENLTQNRYQEQQSEDKSDMSPNIVSVYGNPVGFSVPSTLPADEDPSNSASPTKISSSYDKMEQPNNLGQSLSNQEDKDDTDDPFIYISEEDMLELTRVETTVTSQASSISPNTGQPKKRMSSSIPVHLESTVQRSEKRQLRNSLANKPTMIENYFFHSSSSLNSTTDLDEDIGKGSLKPSFAVGNDEKTKQSLDTRRRPRLGLSKVRSK